MTMKSNCTSYVALDQSLDDKNYLCSVLDAMFPQGSVGIPIIVLPCSFYQALAALKKYRATVQRRGRDAIDNRCGYLIGFLKQYQDGAAVVGPPGSSGQASRGGSLVPSNGDGPYPANSSMHHSSSASSGHHSMANCSRNGGPNGSGGPPTVTVAASAQAGGNGGGSGGVRPISYLQPPVRKQLEKLFESGKDKAVLEDVGLIKQLARLGEDQALAALKNYKEASKHRRDIHNKSAYLMGILRGYIEGTTPITKAPWEGRGNDDGSDTASSAASVPPPSVAGGNRARGRGRGPGPTADDVERTAPNSMPLPQGAPPQQPQLPQQQQSPAPPVAPPLSVPVSRELGGFTTAPPQSQQPTSPHEAPHVPLAAIAATPSTSPVNSSPLGGGGLFLGGIGHSSSNRYDPSSSLLYLEGGSGGRMPGFGSQVNPPDHEEPPRHSSQHEYLFGHPSGDNSARQQHPLVGPGLLGGDFLVNGGGSDRGLGLSRCLPHAALPAHAGVNGAHSNHGLFGSGLLAGDHFDSSNNGGLGNNAPTSPGSRSAQGSTSGLGSSSLSAAGSGEESPLGSDAGNDAQTVTSATTTTSSGTSGAGISACNESTDCTYGGSPRSGEGTENSHSSNSNYNGGVGCVVDMLARLNMSKYVPVLAEAEVDMDALRLFGEVGYRFPQIGNRRAGDVGELLKIMRSKVATPFPAILNTFLVCFSL